MLRATRKSALSLCAMLAILTALPTAPALAAPPHAGNDVLPANCSNRVHTPPAVDSSENPAPGSTVPPPPPVPATPVGGPRMANCDTIVPVGGPALPEHLRFQSWVLFEVDSGDVLAARAPHARLRPASLAKLLLALTVVRELPKDKVVTGTKTDANMPGTKVGIGPGGRYTVDQLMHGLLMHSGNDIAHALAMQLGGRRVALRKENALARSLGALDTHIASPSGLDAPGMCTSAYDLSVIFDRVLQNTYLAKIIRTRTFPFPGYGDKPRFTVGNDNRLLTSYPGDLGGKTGYTDDATHTYANAARRHGGSVGLIMMHNDNELAGMYGNGKALMNYGFALAASGTEPVGHLVHRNPQGTTATATPSSGTIGQASTAAAGSGNSTDLGVPALVLAMLGLLAVSSALVYSWRTRSRLPSREDVTARRG